MTQRTIDLNADAGEDPSALANGREESLVRTLSSVNIACGGHAGDDASVERLAEIARRHDVRMVAHPSYPDRANFGRVRTPIDHDLLHASLAEQIERVKRIAPDINTIKAHGVLYHDGANDPAMARLLVSVAPGMRFVLPPTMRTGSVFEEAGCSVLYEGFADRAYRPDGTLVSRTEPDALVTDPEVAAQQALRLAQEGVAGVPIDTVCVHSDTPNALEIARRVRAVLVGAGFSIAPPGA